MKNICLLIIGAYSSFAMLSCTDFLDVKSDKGLATPSTLKDLDALLQNSNVFGLEPMTAEVSTTDYYVTDGDWQALPDEDLQRAYTWSDNHVIIENVGNDWKTTYDLVYYCNVVLEEIEHIERKSANAVDYDRIKGEAYFFRGKSFLQAALLWTEAYDESIADLKKGIPLRLDPDFNKISVRSTVGETYAQVLSDLQQAAQLLPVHAAHKTRPTKAAALGTLSRVYMAMRNYDKALLYADSTLFYGRILLDYNTLDHKLDRPIRVYNEEVIFSCAFRERRILGVARLRVEPYLMDMYKEDDLRRQILFFQRPDNSYGFKSRFGMDESEALFSGIATNEIILNRAECLVRAGEVEMAKIELLNLLKMRYAGGVPPAIQDTELLRQILDERRKELVFRGIRWMDVKRLNREGRNIIQQRTMNAEEYTLLPNERRYARPLPEYVVDMAGLEQN